MNTNNQASWLWNRPAGIINSFLKYTRANVSTLLDGAYLWWPGEWIIIPFYNKNIRQMDIGLDWDEKVVRITASNPGIKIVVSRFLSSQISGNVLAVLDWEELNPINHFAAVQAWLLEKKDYWDIFMYNGNIGAARLFQKMQNQENDFLWVNPSEQDREELAKYRESYRCAPELPNSAYQVTKKWHGRIFLKDRINQQSPAIQPRMQLQF